MPVYKRYKGRKVTRRKDGTDYDKGTWYAAGMIGGVRYHEPVGKAPYFATTQKEAENAELDIVRKIMTGEYELHKDKTTFREYVEKIYIPRARVDNESFEINKKYQIPVLVDFFEGVALKNISRLQCENLRAFLSEQRVSCQRCEKFKENCYLCSPDAEKPRYKAPCWRCKKRIAAIDEHRKNCKPPRLKSSTVNRYLVTLSDILTDAVIDKKTKENPMRFVKLLTEDEARDRVLSPDEKERLFSAFGDRNHSAINMRLWALVMIACTTSWREGRIMGLKKEHLDYDTCQVWVGKSKQDKAKYAPVSSVTWSVLEFLAGQVESGHLFRNTVTGEPLKLFPHKQWQALLERAGIEDLHFHDLRHQAATDLYERGAKLFGIQKALGHKRITTTQRYIKVEDEGLREDLENLGGAYESFLM